MNNSIIYNLWLVSLNGMGTARCHTVINAFSSAKNAFIASEKDIRLTQGLTEKEKTLLCDKSLNKAQKILDECKQKEIDIIDWESEDYPLLLREIADFPLILYVKGNLGNMKDEFPIAMVGTRRPSVYGVKIAEHFSYEIAAAGMTIVSGMARGIDSLCHQGALRAGMKTVAVLGCGVDVVYPPENDQLMKVIENSGAVISEYPPGSAPLPSHFPPRNRIICGMSLATMVVECTERSGTMITANLANEYGRAVYTVPTNLDNKRGLGNIALARDGAKFAYSPDEIYGDFLVSQRERVMAGVEKQIENPINSDDNYILGMLSNSIPTDIDLLCERCGLTAKEVNAKMALLELQGKVSCLSGQRYVLK